MFPNSFAPVSVVLEWSNGTWGAPEVLREHPTISLRAVGLHYGQIAFEGLRAAPADGRLRAFRPDLHHRRLARSLERLSMPAVPGEAFGAALSSLLEATAVPPDLEPGSFLYLRPLMVAVDEDWSMSGAERFELHVLAGWTLPAFHGLPRVRARVDTTDRRAMSGASGVVKVPANYGSAMVAQRRAQAIGAHTVLWISPASRAIEEFTSMNALAVTSDGVLHAPPPGAGVLDGVVRRTVLELAATAGVAVKHDSVPWPAPDEPSGRIVALLASATAAGLVGVDGVKEVDAAGDIHTWRPASTRREEVVELGHLVDAVLGGAQAEAWWADAPTLAAWPFDDPGAAT